MFQKFFNTWEGIAMAITTAIGATIGLVRAIPPAFAVAKRLIDGGAFFLEIRDTIRDLRKDLNEGFRRVADGQLNEVNIRRFRLDADERNAHFETDARGKFEWVSRVWRNVTGLDNSQARGSGWENGLAPENEEAVLKAWQQAVDHQRQFEMVVIYIDREDRRTPMKVLAAPMRDSLGNVVQFHGICTPIPS